MENNIELGEKNRELEKMNRELEAFNYIASHDLQEPLRKIQTFAGLVLQHEVATLSDKAKGYFLKMQDSALRMQRLIKDLLSYSQATKSEKDFEKTDVNKLVEDLISDFRELTHAKNATFTVSALCQPRIIPLQFRQLIHNLISNSLKFISPERPPHIIIKSETALGSKFQNIELVLEKKYCYISFSDNGIGFNPEYKNKIFELFQHLNPKDQYPGTGIGLAIVKKIIENHNGLITVTSEINKGTTFGIYIPED